MRDMISSPDHMGHDVGARAAPVLQARNLAFRAGGQTLLDRVDLTVPAGQCTVIVGPNGAGKSVLLRLLHGLLRPTRGEVLWHGRHLDRAARRAQAMVFQRPVLLRRSVRANLRFVLSGRGLSRHERRAREAQALVQARLDALADRPARVLSGGEQQRLALARALVTAPEMLFLDEPTASLDPASTQSIEDQIHAARGMGVTPVLVTHDIGQARRLGDRLIFLQNGHIAETGPVADLLGAPQSAAMQAWCEGRLYLPGARPAKVAEAEH